jgi:hypothetical protein
MRLGLHGPLAMLVLLILPGCDKPTTPTKTESDAGSPVADAELQAAETDEAEATGARVAFADAELFFEFNSTDDDLGLQLFLDADGWKRVRVLDPARNEIVFLEAERRLAKLGITELRFESAEPSPEEVLAPVPAWGIPLQGQDGRGRSVGEQRDSVARLSARAHVLTRRRRGGGSEAHRRRMEHTGRRASRADHRAG